MMIECENYSYNEYPKCPHCNYEHVDDCSIDDEGYELSCSSCNKVFYVSVHIDISYSTSKIEEIKD